MSIQGAAIWEGSSEEPPGFPEASALVAEASSAERLGALQGDPGGRRARRGWAGEPAAAHRWVKWRVAAEVEPIRHPGSRSAPRELRVCEPARCTGGHRVALRFSRRACASGLVVHPGSGAARARVVLPRCLGVHREVGVHQQGWSHSQSPGHARRRQDACDRAFAWLSGDTMKTQRPGRLYTSPGGGGGAGGEGEEQRKMMTVTSLYSVFIFLMAFPFYCTRSSQQPAGFSWQISSPH